LKATNTDIAIGKYPIGQTPILKGKNSASLKILKTAQTSQHCYFEHGNKNQLPSANALKER